MICFAMSDKLLAPLKHFLKNENYTQYILIMNTIYEILVNQVVQTESELI